MTEDSDDEPVGSRKNYAPFSPMMIGLTGMCGYGAGG